MRPFRRGEEYDPARRDHVFITPQGVSWASSLPRGGDLEEALKAREIDKQLRGFRQHLERALKYGLTPQMLRDLSSHAERALEAVRRAGVHREALAYYAGLPWGPSKVVFAGSEWGAQRVVRAHGDLFPRGPSGDARRAGAALVLSGEAKEMLTRARDTMTWVEAQARERGRRDETALRRDVEELKRLAGRVDAGELRARVVEGRLAPRALEMMRRAKRLEGDAWKLPRVAHDPGSAPFRLDVAQRVASYMADGSELRKAYEGEVKRREGELKHFEALVERYGERENPGHMRRLLREKEDRILSLRARLDLAKHRLAKFEAQYARTLRTKGSQEAYRAFRALQMGGDSQATLEGIFNSGAAGKAYIARLYDRYYGGDVFDTGMTLRKEGIPVPMSLRDRLEHPERELSYRQMVALRDFVGQSWVQRELSSHFGVHDWDQRADEWRLDNYFARVRQGEIRTPGTYAARSVFEEGWGSYTNPHTARQRAGRDRGLEAQRDDYWEWQYDRVKYFNKEVPLRTRREVARLDPNFKAKGREWYDLVLPEGAEAWHEKSHRSAWTRALSFHDRVQGATNLFELAEARRDFLKEFSRDFDPEDDATSAGGVSRHPLLQYVLREARRREDVLSAAGPGQVLDINVLEGGVRDGEDGDAWRNPAFRRMMADYARDARNRSLIPGVDAGDVERVRQASLENEVLGRNLEPGEGVFRRAYGRDPHTGQR